MDFNNDISGVLFKKPYPGIINSYFHIWSTVEIVKSMKKDDLNILDLGCGYGRIAKVIIKRNRRVKVTGVDIAEQYIKLFNQNLKGRGKGVCTDLSKIIFKKNSFDLIYTVASLMYLTRANQQKLFEKMANMLNKNGQVIIIERSPLMKFTEAFKKSIVSSSFFSIKDINEMSEKSGLHIAKISYWPLNILPLFVCYKLSKK